MNAIFSVELIAWEYLTPPAANPTQIARDFSKRLKLPFAPFEGLQIEVGDASISTTATIALQENLTAAEACLRGTFTVQSVSIILERKIFSLRSAIGFSTLADMQSVAERLTAEYGFDEKHHVRRV